MTHEKLEWFDACLPAVLLLPIHPLVNIDDKGCDALSSHPNRRPRKEF